MWHQHLWVGDHDGTDATEHSPQGGRCVRRARWAQDCPITATGLLRRTLRPDGRDAQSIALASTPGTAPLYSGVAIKTAFEAAMASLKRRNGPGSPAASMSSLKEGHRPMCNKPTSTHSAA